jgi:hypothetical protein
MARRWETNRGSVALHADEPPEPPQSRKIESRSCSCWAYTDAKAKVTSGVRAARHAAADRAPPDGKGKPVELWSVAGWYRVAALSHDCGYLVTGYDGSMVAFHHQGGKPLDLISTSSRSIVTGSRSATAIRARRLRGAELYLAQPTSPMRSVIGSFSAAVVAGRSSSAHCRQNA